MKHKKYLCFSSKVSLIMYIILILYYVFCWYNVLIIHDGKRNQQWDKEHYYACTDYLLTNVNSKKQEIVSTYNYLGINAEICKDITQYGVLPNSSFNIFSEFFAEENFLFPFFIPVIVLLPFIYLISKESKNKMVKNYILRNKYDEYIKYIFSMAYKNIFTIPVIVLITFLISYILSGGNINPKADIGMHYILPNISFLNNPLFIPIYILTLFLGVGLYINIGLIILSKNKNFIVSILESELVIFLVWAFVFIIFGNIFKHIGVNSSNFNLLSIYEWEEINNMYLYFALNLLLFILSYFVAKYSFKNKEKLILMCEK